jgi:hypothetical protein
MCTSIVPPCTHEAADRLRCAAVIVPYPLGEVMAMSEDQMLALVAFRLKTIASSGRSPEEIGKMSRPSRTSRRHAEIDAND